MSNTDQVVNEQPKLNEYEVLKGKAIQLGIEKPHTIKKDVLRQMVADAEAKQPLAMTADGELKKLPGRPANPNSARQQRLADLAARRAAGQLKLGRPIETESERQKRLAERQAKVDAYNAQQAEIANGAIIAEEDLLPNPSMHLGRPIDPESPRQKKLREYEAKKAAGLIKKGRPSFEEKGLPPSKYSKKAKEQNVVNIIIPEAPVEAEVTADVETGA